MVEKTGGGVSEMGGGGETARSRRQARINTEGASILSLGCRGSFEERGYLGKGAVSGGVSSSRDDSIVALELFSNSRRGILASLRCPELQNKSFSKPRRGGMRGGGTCSRLWKKKKNIKKKRKRGGGGGKKVVCSDESRRQQRRRKSLRYKKILVALAGRFDLGRKQFGAVEDKNQTAAQGSSNRKT